MTIDIKAPVRVYPAPLGCTCPPVEYPSTGFGAAPRTRRSHLVGNTDCALVGPEPVDSRDEERDRSKQWAREYIGLHFVHSGVPDTLDRQRQMFFALLTEVPDYVDLPVAVMAAVDEYRTLVAQVRE